MEKTYKYLKDNNKKEALAWIEKRTKTLSVDPKWGDVNSNGTNSNLKASLFFTISIILYKIFC